MAIREEVIDMFHRQGYNVRFENNGRCYIKYSENDKFYITNVKKERTLVNDSSVIVISIDFTLKRFNGYVWETKHRKTIKIPVKSFEKIIANIFDELIDSKYYECVEDDKGLMKIAQKYLNIPTLEARNSDSLDFYDLSVWSIKEALNAAYEKGFSDGKK